MKGLPQHLQKYIVKQNYEKYTALDHAVWRYVLRQLKSFLAEHAHPSYLEGLEKTGISIEQIPRIEDISAHLEKFGWRALPVSGFIPPAAFMELQSLGILPIASDMRSIDHLMYTPAPDIVHEAAGHAPIIANPEYADYLTQYAQVAKKAIISREDLEVYKVIRELSDLKENPASTPEQINTTENKLSEISKSIISVSEASELSRMNWWTAEYGLIGTLENPKIFGAGLLSSVGESKWCLSERVKKIPLTLDCIKQSYDITEPQPQLFVARDFKHLSAVLEELSLSMAYKIGGAKALERAKNAESVNTVEFENGFQVSGLLKNYLSDSNNKPCYLQFTGPTQICAGNKQLDGHGADYHKEGYGTPVGEVILPELKLNEQITLQFKSGVRVEGTLVQMNSKVLTFAKATCSFQNQILFRPEWGNYDIILATEVTSVFGGPADREAYGETDDFVATTVQQPKYSNEQKELFNFYNDVRKLRESKKTETTALFNKFLELAPKEWLLFLELYEINQDPLIKAHLNTLDQKELIEEGLKLATP